MKIELNNKIREFLKQEFESRKSKNPRYSLRGFAFKLEMDYSLLSKFLRGQRSLGMKSLLKIHKILELEELIPLEDLRIQGEAST
jgi:hypothetical protein